MPNFHTRQSWNYVQTQNINLTANINNEDLQEFKNVFNNGITLWHNDDIGNYYLGNGVI
jgi:transcriptional regulator of heat shock response